MNDSDARSEALPKVLLVPGGTSVASVAMAHAALHKLVEGYLGDAADALDASGEAAPARMVVALRDPALVPHASVRNSLRAAAEVFPDLPAASDPRTWDGVDLVVPTSGSSAGTPRLVGLSTAALVASARATHDALEGPGRWILALPAHHIAGVQVLVRAAVAGLAPLVVDTSYGFLPKDLLRAISGATADDDVPGYLSLVPTQLAACLDDLDVARELTRLSAVLVGGSAISPALVDRAREAGIRVHTTYGMTETAGGCAYDGMPLEGTRIRALADDGGRLAISGPTLMTRYLEGESPFRDVDGDGTRWLLTGDIGTVDPDGRVDVSGRADDVIVSGGLSIAPEPVRRAVLDVPGVGDAAIVGVADDRWGQVVAAVVVLIDEAVATALGTSESSAADYRGAGAADEAGATALGSAPAIGPEVRDRVGASLGREQAPRIVVVADRLPTRGPGKVDPVGVRALVAAAVADGTAWIR